MEHDTSSCLRIREWIDEFYRAKRIEGLSKRTVMFYEQQLGHFLNFCELRSIAYILQLTPSLLRDYILWLEENGHNPGGCHAAYRSLKAFLNWYDLEAEPAGWRNPIKKVRAPKVPEDPIEPVEVRDVSKMLATCEGSINGARDRAIMLFLLDTGVRARELLAINRSDLNLETGAVLVRSGKGRKPRTVFMGSDTQNAVSLYLQARKDRQPALFVTDDGRSRLTYGGLRWMLVRRSQSAGIAMPSPHDFRRAFALTMLRNGVDLITLMRLMGHTTLKVLQRYLYQLPGDLQAAHHRSGPVDNAGLLRAV